MLEHSRDRPTHARPPPPRRRRAWPQHHAGADGKMSLQKNTPDADRYLCLLHISTLPQPIKLGVRNQPANHLLIVPFAPWLSVNQTRPLQKQKQTQCWPIVVHHQGPREKPRCCRHEPGTPLPHGSLHCQELYLRCWKKRITQRHHLQSLVLLVTPPLLTGHAPRLAVAHRQNTRADALIDTLI